MNNFFLDKFNISKIELCMLVKPAGCRLYHECRPTHGFVLMLSGKNRYEFLDGRAMTVSKGQVFYLPRASSYRLIQEELGECIAVNFTLADDPKDYPPFCLPQKYEPLFLPIFTRLLDGYGDRHGIGINLCMSCLYNAIYEIQYLARREYLGSRAEQLCSMGAEYIKRNISRSELTVEEVAKQLSVSPEYFRKLFKASYGMSPKRYMLALRIDKAKSLLLSNELTVSHIGELCGYEDESYFCREFKRLVGKTPTEFCGARA